MTKFTELQFKNYTDAQVVLNNAIEIARTYGCVTVADISDLIGEPCSYTDARRGWTESCIKNAKVVCSNEYGYNMVRSVYHIHLPKCNWFDDASMIKPSEATSTVKLNDKPEESGKGISININIPASNYVRDSDRFIKVIKEALDKAAKYQDSKVTINFT